MILHGVPASPSSHFVGTNSSLDEDRPWIKTSSPSSSPKTSTDIWGGYSALTEDELVDEEWIWLSDVDVCPLCEVMWHKTRSPTLRNRLEGPENGKGKKMKAVHCEEKNTTKVVVVQQVPATIRYSSFVFTIDKWLLQFENVELGLRLYQQYPRSIISCLIVKQIVA